MRGCCGFMHALHLSYACTLRLQEGAMGCCVTPQFRLVKCMEGLLYHHAVGASLAGWQLLRRIVAASDGVLFEKVTCDGVTKRVVLALGLKSLASLDVHEMSVYL